MVKNILLNPMLTDLILLQYSTMVGLETGLLGVDADVFLS
jgi:hypothetical protein